MLAKQQNAPEHPLTLRIGYKLRRASSQLMAALAQELATLELASTEASILLLVDSGTAVTQAEICRELGIKRANVVPLVGGLERRGLVCRAPIDGRSFRLTTSDLGATRARAVAAIMDAHEDRFFSALDEAQRAAVVALLDRLNDGFAQSS